MKIIFDKRPGEVKDFLSSLSIAENYEMWLEDVRKYGHEPEEGIKNIVQDIIKNSGIDDDKLRFFFHENGKIQYIYYDGLDIWHAQTLDNYLMFSSSIGDLEVKERLVGTLLSKEKEHERSGDRAVLSSIASDDKKILELIKGYSMDAEFKWNLFCFLDDIKEYTRQYIGILNSYRKYFSTLKHGYQKQIDVFSEYLEKGIEKGGVKFIRELCRDFIDFEKFDEIYVTPSFFNSYGIEFNMEDSKCYLIIGTGFERFLDKIQGKSKLEKNLLVYKNLSDKTRFEIIRMLLKKDCYGQQIAEKTGITTATVSYHMNYLIAAGIVHFERQDHKVYYVLNKDALRESIEFLERELELQEGF